MSDNTVLPVGSGGDTIRDVAKTANNPAKTQVVLLDIGGGADASPETILSSSNPLPVSWSGQSVSITGTVPVTGAFYQATQPVSFSGQSVGITGSVAVTGTFWQATQPVSGSVSITGSVSTNGTDNIAQWGGSPLTVSNPIPIAQSQTNFFFASGNSSTVQLAVNATFTGTMDTVINQNALSLLIESDQPMTVVINQYITNTDTIASQTETYTSTGTTGGYGISRAINLNGNYVQLLVTNNGTATTTKLNVNTYYGTIPQTAQIAATLNQVTGQIDTLENGDNFNDNDLPSGNATGTLPTGLIGAEAYPRMFDGTYWQRIRGSIQGGLNVNVNGNGPASVSLDHAQFDDDGYQYVNPNVPGADIATGDKQTQQLQSLQAIQAGVTVNNFPSTQTVSVNNLPATQAVSGNVSSLSIQDLLESILNELKVHSVLLSALPTAMSASIDLESPDNIRNDIRLTIQ